jgi:uncharacterized protein
VSSVAAPLPYRVARDGVRLAVQLVPKSSSDRVIGCEPAVDGGARLKIAVRAAPRDGAANDALLRLVADLLRLPRRQVTLALGASQRRKLVHVAGDPAELERRLTETFAPWLKRP